MNNERIDEWCAEGRLISHAERERIKAALNRPNEGEHVLVATEEPVKAFRQMTPQEFQSRIIAAKTKKDYVVLLHDLAAESGKCSDMTDEVREKLMAIGFWDC